MHKMGYTLGARLPIGVVGVALAPMAKSASAGGGTANQTMGGAERAMRLSIR